MKKNDESFDDIIFENRNKEYGAYDLRTRYPKRGFIALTISLFILFTAVGWPLLASMLNDEGFRGHIGGDGVIDLTTIPTEKPDVAPPKLPEPPPAPKAQPFQVPEIVDSVSNIEIDYLPTGEFDGTANAPLGDTSSFTPENIVIEKDPVIETIVEIFDLNEKPIFPDGDAGLIKYIAEHTKYPVAAMENNIEGTVYIRFVVTKTGEIGEAKVLREVDQLLENEALRVVKSMPKWIPGKINGKPVNVWFIIPVKFVLQ